jgi:hypothetical protein
MVMNSMQYIGVVFMPLSVVAIGVVLLLKGGGKKIKRVGACIAIVGAILMAFAANYMFTYPARGELERQRHLLFSGSSDEVQAVIIEPCDINDRSSLELVRSQLKVTNPADVTRIIDALRNAKTFPPNHPIATWSCVLVLESNGKPVSVQITDTKTSDNGVLINWSSGRTSGWVLGNYRCDSLGPILEVLANSGRDRNG